MVTPSLIAALNIRAPSDTAIYIRFSSGDAHELALEDICFSLHGTGGTEVKID